MVDVGGRHRLPLRPVWALGSSAVSGRGTQGDGEPCGSGIDDGAADPTALCGAWAITLREGGDLLGTVLLKELPDVEGLAPQREVEVGWHLHPRAWHHGYATEAAEGALNRGFDGGIPEIIALTYKENLPSQAVCRRLAMTHLGQTDRYYGTGLELFMRSRR